MAVINANGGIEDAVSKGGFGATPPPGFVSDFASEN